MTPVDYTGKVFSRLTVIEMVHVKTPRRNVTHCRCRCNCGVVKLILPHSLSSGRTKSCGCFLSQRSAERHTTHGMHDTPEFSVWCAMRKRCRATTSGDAKNYALRGISVCDQWNDATTGFITFFSDMGQRPSSKHSIERIDNNGNYEPRNCRWATKHEQSRNTRRNILITHDGTTLTLQDWAPRLGVSRSTIERRIAKGESADRVISYLLKQHGSP